ncbi:MAG: Rid family hydrolase [Acidimicrobiia bacterium]|jgi:enamine deaminase RidA (YjgF/YER057c/UK114 family)
MRDRIGSASPYEERYGFSRAVRHDDRIEVAGTAPIPQGGGPPPVSAYDQMLLCGSIVRSALEALGATPADVIRTRMYLVDPGDADEVGRAHAEVFGPAAPAATMVVVAALLDPAWKVEIEAEAVVGSARLSDT